MDLKNLQSTVRILRFCNVKKWEQDRSVQNVIYNLRIYTEKENEIF